MNFAEMLLRGAPTGATLVPVVVFSRREQQVLDLLETGKKTTLELAELMGTNPPAVASAIHKLKQKNHIVSVGSIPTGRFGNRTKIWKRKEPHAA